MKLELFVVAWLVASQQVVSADPQIDPTTRSLVLPPIPSFDLPPPAADGTISPRELMISGRRILDREITIKGVVTFAYDCVKANLGPGVTEKQVRARIEQDPTLCERPKFYLGDTASTAPDRSVWVVDVPRPFNALELERIKPADRRDFPGKCEPNEKDPARRICPPYKVGDRIEVTGTWKLASPHDERNSDGLLVYGWMKNTTQGWTSPGTRPPTSTAPVARTRPAWLSAPLPPIAAPPAKAKLERSVQAASTKLVNEGTIAYGQRQWDTAIERYTKAIDTWPENTTALHGLTNAYAQKKQWDRAADVARRAVAVEPTTAVFRLTYGHALYEAAIARAREDLAARTNTRPGEVELDFSTLDLSKALPELRIAAKLQPGLWRAHYLIAKIHGFADDPKTAAVSYDRALRSGPVDPAPWIATIELYRRWGHLDEAARIAELGAGVVVHPDDRADLWFEHGLVHDDRGDLDQAIASYDRALADRPRHVRALFVRGQAHVKRRDLARAKPDLEAFLALASPDDPLVPQAKRWLAELASDRTR